MVRKTPEFVTRLATTPEDIAAAQHLRYRVFVAELGAGGAMVDHDSQLEQDQFDGHFDHLMLLDLAREGDVREQIVGVYRLLPDDRLDRVGHFYSESEFDLAPLRATGRRLLELGRSCLDAEYRGGAGMYHLWNALADYVTAQRVEILFGVASFHGTNVDRIARPLSLLHHRHLAPEGLRVRSRAFQPMDLIAEDALDRIAAMREVPALIKGYLRLGGFVGDGAFIDRDFNTIDVCLVLDTTQMNERQRRIYAGEAR